MHTFGVCGYNSKCYVNPCFCEVASSKSQLCVHQSHSFYLDLLDYQSRVPEAIQRVLILIGEDKY